MSNDYPPPPPSPDNSGYPGGDAPQPGHPAPPAYSPQQGGYPGQYGQPAYGQPGYGQPYVQEDPGKTMGIVGLVLGIAGLFFWFLAPIAAIIVSAIARGKSKRAGFPNTPALWGLILGIVFLVLNILAVVAIGWFIAATAGEILQMCEDLGPGIHEVYGEQIQCY
jgi:hypothetical protein